VSRGDRGAQQDTLSAGTAVGTSSCPARPQLGATASLPVPYKTPLHCKLTPPLTPMTACLMPSCAVAMKLEKWLRHMAPHLIST
jgi:hypothetical protein